MLSNAATLHRSKNLELDYLRRAGVAHEERMAEQGI
jgi:hypothetical protein